ncbi:MAG: ferrochelatase [Roseovarius sp.]
MDASPPRPPRPPRATARRPEHAPADHPAVTPPRIGILLANLGTPDHHGYWAMRRYLSEFLSDRRVIDYPRWKWQPLLQLVILSRRPFTSGAAYRAIWNEERNEGPLMTITRAQTERLAEAMRARHGDKVVVDFCMRYGNPSTRARLRALIEAGCRRILFLPLYPHYAAATSATACDALFRALMDEVWQPAIRVVEPYFEHPLYVDALARSIEAAYAELPERPQKLLVSYHGMPRRYLMQGDPYHCQCQKSTRLLRERLGWAPEEIVTSFQSVFGPEEWLRPYTVEEVARLAREEGITRLAVVAPGFAADCLETLEEIRGEIRESFERAGGRSFTYIPCLNDSDAHIRALSAVIEDNLGGWLD